MRNAIAGSYTTCFTARVYRLRVATDADIGFLADVVIEATRDQGRMPPDFDVLAFRTGFSRSTAQQIADAAGPSTTYVIEVNDQAVGRLRVVRTQEQIELAGIQLLPGHQSRGIGTEIISDLIREASEAARTMTLSVEKDNPRAEALYRGLGFVTTDETDKEFVMHGPASPFEIRR